MHAKNISFRRIKIRFIHGCSVSSDYRREIKRKFLGKSVYTFSLSFFIAFYCKHVVLKAHSGCNCTCFCILLHREKARENDAGHILRNEWQQKGKTKPTE